MQKKVICWVSQSKQRSHRLIFALDMTSKFFHRTAEQQLKLHWRHDNISFSNAVVCFFQCVDVCFARWPKIFTLRTFMRNTPSIGIFHGGNASSYLFGTLGLHCSTHTYRPDASGTCILSKEYVTKKGSVQNRPECVAAHLIFFKFFLLSTPSECNTVKDPQKIRKI